MRNYFQHTILCLAVALSCGLIMSHLNAAQAPKPLKEKPQHQAIQQDVPQETAAIPPQQISIILPDLHTQSPEESKHEDDSADEEYDYDDDEHEETDEEEKEDKDNNHWMIMRPEHVDAFHMILMKALGVNDPENQIKNTLDLLNNQKKIDEINECNEKRHNENQTTNNPFADIIAIVIKDKNISPAIIKAASVMLNSAYGIKQFHCTDDTTSPKN